MSDTRPHPDDIRLSDIRFEALRGNSEVHELLSAIRNETAARARISKEQRLENDYFRGLQVGVEQGDINLCGVIADCRDKLMTS